MVANKTDRRAVVLPAYWQRDNDAIRKIRETVFIQELGIDPSLEWDSLDPDCAHWLLVLGDGKPVATARRTPALQIGRMAVLSEYRRLGYGSILLAGILDSTADASRHWLNAQISAKTFYERHGFRAEGAVYTEAGIPHQRMIYKPGIAS